MPSPPGLTTSRILLAIVLCWVTAIVPASCSGSGERSDVISVRFPSFKSTGGLQLSWDAGVIDGALHLTTDDVYQPPVHYPPDWRRSAGYAILWDSIPLSLGSEFAGELSSQEASFNTTFTMSVSWSPDQTAATAKHDAGGGFMFEVLPGSSTGFDRATYFSLASTTSGNISVEIGKLDYYYRQGTSSLYVCITPAPNATPAAANYTVWIDYDAVGHNLSVYLDDDGETKPGQASLHAPLEISGIVTETPFGSNFGLFASKNRSLPSCRAVVYSWNLTVDRLSTSTGGRRKGWFLAVVLSLVIVAAGAAMVFAAACYLESCLSRYRALKTKLKLSKVLRRLPGIPREYKYADVKKATRNFHESMRLGRGGFGAVYKGRMIGSTGDGEDRRRRRYIEVAVKKFERKENRSYDDFLAEVAVISRLRHKNIVSLIGWCYENGELLLIYQYMPNGSLDQHLFRDNRHQHLPVLRWETRYNVIKDVAAGLHYVHHEYERVVLHRDIKASNIMLDAAFHGRLGDFGLARVVGYDKNSFTDLGVAGTWGFIAPEYPVSHKATRQTDVYAFGVLILEVVTGKRSLSAAEAEFPLLTDWVWWLHGEGRLLEAVDDELTAAGKFDADDATRLLEAVDVGDDRNTAEGEFDAADATQLLLLGLACSNPNPSDRPSMAEVVQVIAKTMPPPDVPLAKPTFVWPPDGELPLLDDSDDDFVGMSHDESYQSHREETESRDGFAMSIGSLEITVRRSRNVREAITGEIESCVYCSH